MHLDESKSVKINIQMPHVRQNSRGHGSSLSVRERSHPSQKFDKLADLVKSAKSFVDHQERQKPRILKLKKEQIYQKNHHDFMVTDTLRNLICKEKKVKKEIQTLSLDNYFETIIKERMDKAEGKLNEFNTKDEVKIKKMPTLQKNILFT